MSKMMALIRAWLVLDFFGDARRAGSTATSTLTTTIFTQSFLALVFAAMLYPETPPIPFAAANLCLSSLLIAVGALGNEERPQRRIADAHLLAVAPIRRSIVVLARSGHAAFHVALVTIGMALPPAILLAQLQHSFLLAPAYLVLACFCSGLACGTLAVSFGVAARWLGSTRATLMMGTGKALLLGFGLVLFAIGLRGLQGDAASMPIGRLGVELLPPYQAARLLASPASEAWRLLPLLAAAFVLLSIATMLGDEPTRRARGNRRRGHLQAVLRWLAGRGPRLAIAEFVATSMWRSAGFRGRVLPLLGFPAGMAFLSARGGGQGDGYVFTCLLLQLPAIYLPFLINFLPRADQPDANWVFAHAPRLTIELVRDATWRALVTHVLMPVHGLALMILLSLRPDRLGTLAAVLIAFALAVFAARVLVQKLTVVPFTRAGDADHGLDLGGAFGCALVLGGLGAAFGGLLPAALRLPVAVLATAAAVWTLRRIPRESAGALLAVDEPDQAGERNEDAVDLDASGSRESALAAIKVASLRGELRAIAVLYVGLCVLPLAVGTMFAA